jgi:putative ABC transport system permease protein
MLSNFFKIAFRNITRHKGFSFINIAGLSLGLTACILIGLFVWDEHQYDKFLPDGDQVYRVYTEYKNSDGTQMMAVTPPMFASTLDKDFPEVEKTARVMMLSEYKTLFELVKINCMSRVAPLLILHSSMFSQSPLNMALQPMH